MAILLLLSTVSWTVDKHLCMGRVMDISFFSSAEDCGMGDGLESLDSCIKEMPCCDDESFTLEGQDDLNVGWEELRLDQQQFFVAFAITFFGWDVSIDEQPLPNSDYPPPLLTKELHILHETYLI